MTCPKCHGDMRNYERSNVTIDQCTECRGIFLDRGELEKLFEAEASWNQGGARPGQGVPPPPQPAHGGQQHQGGYAPPPPPPYGQGAPMPPPPPPTHGYPQQQQPVYGGHQGYHGHYRNKKQKSFLNQLFD